MQNDLASLYPELVTQWHPTKNGKIRPDEFTAGSGKKVWWICKKGHSWRAQIRHRTTSKSGCPECSKIESISKGKHTTLLKYGSLADNRPELALQWHPSKNGSLDPSDVHTYSNKVVWWQCENGHEYQASVTKVSQRKNSSYCLQCSKSSQLALGLDSNMTV